MCSPSLSLILSLSSTKLWCNPFSLSLSFQTNTSQSHTGAWRSSKCLLPWIPQSPPIACRLWTVPVLACPTSHHAISPKALGRKASCSNWPHHAIPLHMSISVEHMSHGWLVFWLTDSRSLFQFKPGLQGRKSHSNLQAANRKWWAEAKRPVWGQWQG